MPKPSVMRCCLKPVEMFVRLLAQVHCFMPTVIKRDMRRAENVRGLAQRPDPLPSALCACVTALLPTSHVLCACSIIRPRLGSTYDASYRSL